MDSATARPKYWELLSREDQVSYAALQREFAEPSRKNRRNRSLQTFGEIIDAVKRFVVRCDNNDWRRALVCGICWFESAVAINTRHLRLLISKCKSSINGSLQLLGYGIPTSGAECTAEIVRCLPILKDNFAELRQWTLRCPLQPAPFVSPAPTEAALAFEAPLSFAPGDCGLSGWRGADFAFPDLEL
ncbi:MAG: hypothetical protein LBD77_00510 [Bifidobacteriaceae bacterium]|jgi:hypothetical protein|nr:hypothetical protein [Bifidobacteriaceae bacterium]